jgi:hypothetical protein
MMKNGGVLRKTTRELKKPVNVKKNGYMCLNLWPVLFTERRIILNAINIMLMDSIGQSRGNVGRTWWLFMILTMTLMMFASVVVIK